jgi:hypothetical protein
MMRAIFTWFRSGFFVVMGALWDWQIAHPVLSKCAVCLLVGFVLGLFAGCAAPEYVYWCLRSAPNTGGPFCP